MYLMETYSMDSTQHDAWVVDCDNVEMMELMKEEVQKRTE